MTPEAFARYHAAIRAEQQQSRPWGEFRFAYTLRGLYGRSQRCRKGLHWACGGRLGRGRMERRPCPCPCHDLDGRAYEC